MAIILALAAQVLGLQACHDTWLHENFFFLDDAGPSHPPTVSHTQQRTTCCGHPRHPSLPTPAERCGTRAIRPLPSPAPQNRSVGLRPAPRRLPSGLRRRACVRSRVRSLGLTLVRPRGGLRFVSPGPGPRHPARQPARQPRGRRLPSSRPAAPALPAGGVRPGHVTLAAARPRSHGPRPLRQSQSWLRESSRRRRRRRRPRPQRTGRGSRCQGPVSPPPPPPQSPVRGSAGPSWSGAEPWRPPCEVRRLGSPWPPDPPLPHALGSRSPPPGRARMRVR